jgi:hypothetical protein
VTYFGNRVRFDPSLYAASVLNRAYIVRRNDDLEATFHVDGLANTEARRPHPASTKYLLASNCTDNLRGRPRSHPQMMPKSLTFDTQVDIIAEVNKNNNSSSSNNNNNSKSTTTTTKTTNNKNSTTTNNNKDRSSSNNNKDSSSSNNSKKSKGQMDADAAYLRGAKKFAGLKEKIAKLTTDRAAERAKKAYTTMNKAGDMSSSNNPDISTSTSRNNNNSNNNNIPKAIGEKKACKKDKNTKKHKKSSNTSTNNNIGSSNNDQNSSNHTNNKNSTTTTNNKDNSSSSSGSSTTTLQRHSSSSLIDLSTPETNEGLSASMVTFTLPRMSSRKVGYFINK